MPLIPSAYLPPIGLRGGHLATIYPTLFRRVPSLPYQRERLELEDGDFLDLDWSRDNADRLVIISHGLEGSSRAKYVQGMGRALKKRGWDVLAWNCRGCSGEPNRLLRSYHSGASEDLSFVTDRALKDYEEIALVGFSLGGNITLKYLREQGSSLHPKIKAAVAFSVPCDLTSSSLRLAARENAIYMRRFIKTLKEKVIEKDHRFPGQIDLTEIEQMRTFADFDEQFTAPLNGFESAEDYWTKASSLPGLEKVSIPILLVQARNDPFLTESCWPVSLAQDHEYFHLELPTHGGHVGFASRGREYWSETRAAEFLKQHVGSSE